MEFDLARQEIKTPQPTTISKRKKKVKRKEDNIFLLKTTGNIIKNVIYLGLIFGCS